MDKKEIEVDLIEEYKTAYIEHKGVTDVAHRMFYGGVCEGLEMALTLLGFDKEDITQLQSILMDGEVSGQ